jgi:hypothetical protein
MSLCKETTLSFLTNLSCEYSSRKVQENHEGLEVNGTHQVLQVCVDIVDTLVEHKFIVKKYTEVVLVANKVAGSEVNSENCI